MPFTSTILNAAVLSLKAHTLQQQKSGPWLTLKALSKQGTTQVETKVGSLVKKAGKKINQVYSFLTMSDSRFKVEACRLGENPSMLHSSSWLQMVYHYTKYF